MGPLPTTKDHWWRMIFEHDVVSIVMITGLAENGKSKCSMYWPKPKKKEKYGVSQITVTNDKTVKGKNFITTHLTATRPKSKRSPAKMLKIVHFWYHTWPDHDIPKGGNTAGLIGISKV